MAGITIIAVVWIIAEYWSRTVIAIKGSGQQGKTEVASADSAPKEHRKIGYK